MLQEARIKAAVEQGGISRVIVIDDAFDPPSIGDEDAGPLLELLTLEAHAWARKRAKLTEEEVSAAVEALTTTEYDDEAIRLVVAKLYARFVERFDPRFDPSGAFDKHKGSNLSYVRPLLRLLGKCRGVEVVRIGSRDQVADLDRHQAQVVFIDYYLDRAFNPESDPDGEEGAAARGASIRMLRAVLAAQPGSGPSVVLMSSHAVRDRADAFRREVRGSKRPIFASRFAYLAKEDLKEDEAGDVDVAPAAADALLDIAQRHLFAGAIEDALTHWKVGVDKAVEDVWSIISGLELKDFAYLTRFRLAEEGQPLSSYLEWFFGEVLIDAVARKVAWDQPSWLLLDASAGKGQAGSQIEGAFDGPTIGIAELYYRARVDARPERQGKDMRVGDIYLGSNASEVLAVITPECDLVLRSNGRRSALRMTAVAGRLNPLSGPDTSVADFLIHDGSMVNVVWNTKDVRTIEFESIGTPDGYRLIGTLRPLYAYELQRRVLNDLGRVGLAVAPALAVNATASVIVRGKAGPVRLTLPREAEARCAVIPKRGGTDKPRIIYQRSFVDDVLTGLAAAADEIHEDATLELKELLSAKAQIGFAELLCRAGQEDGDQAYGVLSTLLPARTGKKAPWCQILVEASIIEEASDPGDAPIGDQFEGMDIDDSLPGELALPEQDVAIDAVEPQQEVIPVGAGDGGQPDKPDAPTSDSENNVPGGQ